jgi:membrane-bound metal-dependent hydrolase YbcI (DUF457 family)
LANFKTHIVVGATVSGVMSSTLLSTNYIDSSDAFIIFTLGTLGSLMPDLDSKTSIPFKVAVSLITVFASFFIIFSKNHYSLLEMGILWVSSYYILHYLFMNVFIKFTSHRGIFHSIPMGFLLGTLTAIALNSFFWLDNRLAVWGGFAVTVGYLTHLILDEVYSVDLLNKRLKKSFGTAFTLFKKDNMLGTAVVYVLLFTLFQSIGNYTTVTETILSKSLYVEIWENLLPNGEWFKDLINI